MKQYLIPLLLVFTYANLWAQTDYYRQELLNLADLSRLPLYRAGDIELLSSYDRTGDNDDGFSGKYSAIRKDDEGIVMADLKGPGVINRIWTPTPELDTIKFYFDGEKTPRISLPFYELFSGKTYPFVAPLCGNDVGGYYCFLPVPYEKSLRIVYTGRLLRFHQTEFRSLPESEKMVSFSMDMLKNYKDVFDKIMALWSRQVSPLEAYKNLKSKKINLTLKTGTEASLIELKYGGRIVGIEMGTGGDLLQAYRKVMLTATWDSEAIPALNLPLHDYFGFAFGKPAMQSIMLGCDKNKMYSYLPMPFDRSAKLTLKYDHLKPGDPDEIQISATIYYTEEKRIPLLEGKFYAQSRREYNPASGELYTIADVKGKGHFVGSILVAQGLEDGHTAFFEGDDQTIIDGQMKMHGTGSEDYFSGGYYAIMDKWDRGISLPEHGCLEYSQMTSRTGGYRFYLNDKMNFNSSLNLTIEHQPDPKWNVKVDYSSVGLFYAQNPRFENTEIRIDDKVIPVAHRNKLTPQSMKMVLYWNASAFYHDECIEFSSKISNDWTTTIDIEAIPIAQIHLDELDNGTYKLYVEYKKTENGNPFSIWQRTKQVSDWIPTDISIAEKTNTVYVGDIQITDKLKTITLRKKKSDDVTVNLCALFFEKIN
jgi:hypothetical protein